MPEQTSAFDAHDLKEEMRPSELWTPETGYRDDWSEDDRDDFVEPLEDGMLPHPVLDPQHGHIHVLSDDVVQVTTDEDIYHELVEWLDEVFDIPRGYDVYWVDLNAPDKRSSVEPHALIHLRDDFETRVFWPEDDHPTLVHRYQRGPYSNTNVFAFIGDGGIRVEREEDAMAPMSPSESANEADKHHRGDDASLGKNGWTWWEIVGTGLELDALR